MPAAKIRAGLIDLRGRPARAGVASAIADPRAGQTQLTRSALAERLAIQEKSEPSLPPDRPEWARWPSVGQRVIRVFLLFGMKIANFLRQGGSIP